MKKWLSTFLFLFFLGSLIFFWGCGGKKTDLKGTSALISLIPEDAVGVFSMNFKKFSQLDIFDKLVADMKKDKPESEDEIFTSYQDFIDKTGIDPKKDLYALAVGMFGDVKLMGKSTEDPDADLVVIVDLKYNQEKILKMITMRGIEISEEKYAGFVFYQFTDKKGRLMGLTFVSDKIIAFGKVNRVKNVVDIAAGKEKNIFVNAKKKSYLNELKADSIASFLFDFPEDLKSGQQQEGSPFKMDLSKAEAFFGYFDFDGSAWSGEIKLMSFDEEANKQIVNLLNGLKGMGALAGPEVAELVNNIQLTSESDHIKLSFSLSNELLEKLRKKAKEKRESIQRFNDTEEEAIE